MSDAEWDVLFYFANRDKNGEQLKDERFYKVAGHCKELREAAEDLFAELVIHRYGDPMTKSEKKLREVLSKSPQDYEEIN